MGAKGGKRSKGGKEVLGWPPSVVTTSCRGEGREGREGGEGSEGISILCFRVPTTCGGKGEGR